jgi:alpha-beta hydrolase superfamily lysophospholipase
MIETAEMNRPESQDVAIRHFVVGRQFGAIHYPPERATRRGSIVLCSPLGRDWRSLYRSNFEWANLLAGSGFHVLRFDLRGTGDSCGFEPEIDQWEDWIQGIVEVAAFARATFPADTLCLAGFRIGGTLAACAAEAAGADYLMLLAPYLRGAVWLRELQLEAALREAGVGVGGEYNGIRLSEATERAVRSATVKSLPASVRGVFIAALDRKRWPAALGIEPVHTQAFPGWNELFKDSHINRLPWEVLHAATDWIRERVEVSDPQTVSATPDVEPCLSDDGWAERPFVFGDRLQGVLTMPETPRSTSVVVFGSTAADPRAGASGFCACIARSLAKSGITTLRFDFSGVGESRGRTDTRPHVYEASRVDEFAAAAAALNRQGFHDLVLAGLCSGGFHAVDAVLRDGRFDKAIVFNSWLIWRSGPLDVGAQAYAMRSEQMRVPGSRGATATLFRVLYNRLMTLRNIVRGWRPDRHRREFQRRVRAGVERGMKVRIVFGRRDRAHLAFWSDFGPAGWMFWRHNGCSVQVLDSLDHSLLLAKSQKLAADEIAKFVQENERAATARDTEPVRLVELCG